MTIKSEVNALGHMKKSSICKFCKKPVTCKIERVRLHLQKCLPCLSRGSEDKENADFESDDGIRNEEDLPAFSSSPPAGIWTPESQQPTNTFVCPKTQGPSSKPSPALFPSPLPS